MAYKILVVDDERTLSFRGDYLPLGAEVVHARTSKEALKLLRDHRDWEEVWLDHDLGLDENGEEDTGMKVVNKAVFGASAIIPPSTAVYVHSMNPVAARRMAEKLAGVRTKVYRVDLRNPAVKRLMSVSVGQ